MTDKNAVISTIKRPGAKIDAITLNPTDDTKTQTKISQQMMKNALSQAKKGTVVICAITT